jgi:uncharacterized protein (DUF924 family)
MSTIEEILTFWFGKPQDDEAYYKERSAIWFDHKPEFDQEIGTRFATDYQLAAGRKLMEWQSTPHSGLAFVILLDQFPRNMFRDDPRAFATDPLAREVAAHLIQENFDQQLLLVERLFVYLPFMHSEDLLHQQRSVALFQQLAKEQHYLDAVSYAVHHMEIIERFGRFPHRNAALRRPSTPEEQEFLQQPGSSF